MMNLLFGTHGSCRLQARSLIHHVSPDCFRQPGFKSHKTATKCLWSPHLTHQPRAYHFSIVRTITEITECIGNQIAEVLLIIPMKQMKISGMWDLKAVQSKAVGVFKEIILPPSTWKLQTNHADSSNIIV